MLHVACLCVFVVQQDVSLVYQIFTDDVLGSGQFGVVYRGEVICNVITRSNVFHVDKTHRSVFKNPIKVLTGSRVNQSPSKL